MGRGCLMICSSFDSFRDPGLEVVLHEAYKEKETYRYLTGEAQVRCCSFLLAVGAVDVISGTAVGGATGRIFSFSPFGGGLSCRLCCGREKAEMQHKGICRELKEPGCHA